MKIIHRAFCMFFALGISVVSVFAGLRTSYSDAEVVKRATLIVVGHIREGSIELVPHRTDPVGGMSWEHHVVLEISEVLKGHTSTNSMIVSIHYGLDPCDASGVCDVPWHRVAFTNQTVRLFDTVHMDTALQWGPFTDDIRTNHIWLLRQESRPVPYGESDCIGIYDQEDIQPMSKKSELITYLK